MDSDSKRARWQELEQEIRSHDPDLGDAHIEEKIWQLFGEKLCIVFTDLIASSKSLETDGLVPLLHTIILVRDTISPSIERHDGAFLKQIGDSFLIVFQDPVETLMATVEMQRSLSALNKTREADQQLSLAIGAGYGPVIHIDSDLFGLEVNKASKLGEDIGTGYEILLTAAMYEAVSGTPNISFTHFENEMLNAFCIHY